MKLKGLAYFATAAAVVTAVLFWVTLFVAVWSPEPNWDGTSASLFLLAVVLGIAAAILWNYDEDA